MSGIFGVWIDLRIFHGNVFGFLRHRKFVVERHCRAGGQKLCYPAA